MCVCVCVYVCVCVCMCVCVCFCVCVVKKNKGIEQNTGVLINNPFSFKLREMFVEKHVFSSKKR